MHIIKCLGEIMDKVVVVTGGTSGIGRELVNMYLRDGDQVVILANQNLYKMENVILCDVSNEDQIKEAFETIKSKYGRVDILVNCAGYGVSGALELVSNKQVEDIMDVNFLGVYNCTKYALPIMPKGSNVINISSACALFPLPFRGLYCASKAAVSLLSYSWRMECAPFGVNIGTVCPGDVRTEFTKNRVKNFETNERYGTRIKTATEKLDARQNKRMEPIKVAKKIYKYSLKKKPKPMIIIGAKYKMLYFASKIFPLSWIMHFTQKLYGGK